MADHRNTKKTPIIYIVANWWWIIFLSISVASLIAGATGMLMTPNAVPDPDTYPARFVVIGAVALAWSIPGWALTLYRIVTT